MWPNAQAYEVARARRQYDAVDPDNRLVAGELERRSNEKLVQLRDLEMQLGNLDQTEQTPALSAEARARLMTLGKDLAKAWNNPGVSVETRKKIIRLLIKEIVVEERLALSELLEKAGDGDFLRSVAEAVLQLLMETDVEGLIGAGRYERGGERTTWRNGHRDRVFDTRLGSLQLRIPKLRQGSYFPPFLEARKISEKALIAVIQEAWIGGVSTRRVEELVQAMGLSGIGKSQVSKLCKDIDERVHAFLDRPLLGEWPYLRLDATYLKQREGGRIVSVAAIIAVAVNTDGKREILGLHIGPSEAETFWSGFLKSLARRGLHGVKLVISDAHEGLKAAIRRVFTATWQRCRVHWMRNALSYVAKTQQSMVAAALRQALSSRIVRRQARRCVTWPISCGRSGRSSRRSLTTARPTFCRIWTSPSSTGPSCTAPTRWSD